MPQWYWCQEHERAEPEGDACGQDRRLGPYESRQAAENWKQRHQEREERWEEQEEAWASWGADDADDADAEDAEEADDPDADADGATER